MPDPYVNVSNAELRRALVEARDVIGDAVVLLARASDLLAAHHDDVGAAELAPKIADLAAARARLRPHLAIPPRRT